MNHEIAHVLQFFHYAHLNEPLRSISEAFASLAQKVADGAQNHETAIALRKLLEAKDAAVRAEAIRAGMVFPVGKEIDES